MSASQKPSQAVQLRVCVCCCGLEPYLLVITVGAQPTPQLAGVSNIAQVQEAHLHSTQGQHTVLCTGPCSLLQSSSTKLPNSITRAVSSVCLQATYEHKHHAAALEQDLGLSPSWTLKPTPCSHRTNVDRVFVVDGGPHLLLCWLELTQFVQQAECRGRATGIARQPWLNIVHLQAQKRSSC